MDSTDQTAWADGQPDRALQGKILSGLLITTLLVGTVYLYSEWKINGSIEDPLFVGFIFANSVVVYRYFSYLRYRLPGFATAMRKAFPDREPLLTDYLKAVFSPSGSLITALLYGALFGAGIYYLELAYRDQHQLRLAFCAFMFFHNALVGVGIYTLIMHLKQCATHFSAMVPVSLWNRSHPVTADYFNINRSIVMVVAIICGVAMTSLLVSVFDMSDVPIIAFSVGCASVVFITYLIPIVGITQRLRLEKERELDRLGRLMNRSYESLQCESGDLPEVAGIERFNHLNGLLEQVSAIQTFPPIGIRTAETAAYALLLTMLPSLIDFILSLD